MAYESKGESSRKCETTEDEKPLKKARYIWEVKGKYHLKEAYKNNLKDCKNETVKNVEERNNTDVVNNEQNNNNCCANKWSIESFLAKTEAIMDSDDDELPTKNIDQSIFNEIPITLVTPTPKNQEYYLRKWQARQIARGFVDNTINSVLESWTNPPIDAAEFIEICESDGLVEDEGILMAIQSHGLQSNLRGNIEVQNTKKPSESESPTSFMRNQEIEESTLDNFENYQNELIKESGGISSSSNTDSMSCDSTQETQDDKVEMDDPIDFLNAAVSVAIQKKGLFYGY